MAKVNVNRLVRSGQIKQLENKGYNVNYEIIEVTRQDIYAKNDNAKLLCEKMKELLNYTVEEYIKTPFSDNEEQIKHKLDLLIDIEEIVRTIVWLSNVSWQDFWDKAKLGTMQGFKTYARVGEPNLQGCVKEYLTFNNIADLCYIETSLFDELKRFSPNYGKFYIKFQDKSKAKRKAQGSYKTGYYLKSYEYVASDENACKK